MDAQRPISPRERRLLLTVFDGEPFEAEAKQIPDLRRLERFGFVMTVDGSKWGLTPQGRAEVAALKNAAWLMGGNDDSAVGAAAVTDSHGGAAAEGEGASQKETDGPIMVTPDEARVNDEAIQRLVKDPQLYQRAGRLVRICLLYTSRCV